MNEMIDVNRIKQMFVEEWVLLDNPEKHPVLGLQRGKLLCHSKNREEVYQKAMELQPRRFAIFFTGPFPENVFLNL